MSAAVTDFLRDDLNERQLERTAFGIAQPAPRSGAADAAGVAVRALFDAATITPDMLGELLFNGQAQHAFKHDFTLRRPGRRGRSGSSESPHAARRRRRHARPRHQPDHDQVFPVDANGDHQTGQPIAIADNGARDRVDLQRLSAGRVACRQIASTSISAGASIINDGCPQRTPAQPARQPGLDAEFGN